MNNPEKRKGGAVSSQKKSRVLEGNSSRRGGGGKSPRTVQIYKGEDKGNVKEREGEEKPLLPAKKVGGKGTFGKGGKLGRGGIKKIRKVGLLISDLGGRERGG